MPREPSTRWALLEELAALRCQVAELQQRVGELTREEQAVEREKERLFTVLLNMPVMIDAFDADWNIVLWNRECERVTGYSAAEIIGNPKALELLYPKRAYRERPRTGGRRVLLGTTYPHGYRLPPGGRGGLGWRSQSRRRRRGHCGSPKNGFGPSLRMQQMDSSLPMSARVSFVWRTKPCVT